MAHLPSDPPIGYDAQVNKDVVFMDLKKLAAYLAGKPEHPVHRQPLSADNILNFAFRIE